METIPNEKTRLQITNAKNTCTNVQNNKKQTAPDLLNSSLFYTYTQAFPQYQIEVSFQWMAS